LILPGIYLLFAASGYSSKAKWLFLIKNFGKLHNFPIVWGDFILNPKLKKIKNKKLFKTMHEIFK
jgi:hypothetical protein